MPDLKIDQITYDKNLSLWWKILDVLYPPFCCYCGKIGDELCPVCFEGIEEILVNAICNFCGSPLDKKGRCKYLARHKIFHFDQARSWALYNGPLKSALRKIKYARGFGLIKHLVFPLAVYISAWSINFDFIVPVALGNERKKERGYNQAERIARPVAKLLDKPIISNALARIRETRSQVGLNKDERQENVKDAFLARSELCEHKNILLFDDITTTFSTLNASASALRSAGANSVYCFTVARTIFQQEKEKK